MPNTLCSNKFVYSKHIFIMLKGINFQQNKFKLLSSVNKKVLIPYYKLRLPYSKFNISLSQNDYGLFRKKSITVDLKSRFIGWCMSSDTKRLMPPLIFGDNIDKELKLLSNDDINGCKIFCPDINNSFMEQHFDKILKFLCVNSLESKNIAGNINIENNNLGIEGEIIFLPFYECKNIFRYPNKGFWYSNGYHDNLTLQKYPFPINRNFMYHWKNGNSFPMKIFEDDYFTVQDPFLWLRDCFLRSFIGMLLFMYPLQEFCILVGPIFGILSVVLKIIAHDGPYIQYIIDSHTNSSNDLIKLINEYNLKGVYKFNSFSSKDIDKLVVLFGLKNAFSSTQLKTAYHLLVKEFHPDKIGEGDENNKRIQEINSAYEILKIHCRN